MAELHQLIAELKAASDHPQAVLDRYLKDGKRVVGCFPIYTPEELVHAAGMVPMGLWGGQITPTVAGKYNPIFTCSIMRSCLEFGMKNIYRGLSCVIMPVLCDTFRGMSSAWQAGVPDLPLVSFIHPQNRTDSGAPAFLASEYQAVKEELESICNCDITDDALAASIDVYNKHSAVMMEFSQVANDHLDVITPVVRHAVMKSGCFLEKQEHTDKVLALIAALRERPVHAWKGKRVVLTGITAEPDEFLQMFEENKVAVVGDDLAQESRLYRTPIPVEGFPLERLANQWLDRSGCSSVHEVHSGRARLLVDMAHEAKADGIAVCLMRFCDVEEYEYPFLAKAATDAGLYCLCLEIDQSTQNNEQSRTKIQSFAEIE